MTNNGFLFYGKYFTAANATVLKSINEAIYASPVHQIDMAYSGNPYKFECYTTYPGLLIGSGYGHDYKNPGQDELTNEGFKIGFFFDHSTGMPVIPGSSIKGALRSCFPQRSVQKTKKITEERYRAPRRKFIGEFIRINLQISIEPDIDKLEDEIFHGIRNGRPIPLYERDIFFDAVPVKVENEQQHLFDPDYITPHYPDLLQNPNPLKFLKVASNVQYRFEFRLNDSEVCKEMTKEKKLQLFRLLILLIGLGAKTNVGYGQFSEKPMPVIAANAGNGKQAAQEKNFSLNKETFKKEDKNVAMKVKVAGDDFVFVTEKGSEFIKPKATVYEKFKEIADKKGKQYEELKEGMDITIRFNADVTAVSDTANFTVLPILK